MAKRKTARSIVLDFMDGIMKTTVPAHEALCDDGKCNLEQPCPYCKMSDLMMEELKRF